MLSYKCSSACRHCLYRCSPAQPDDWMTGQMMRRVCRALASERNLCGVHIGGGEPGLRTDLVEELVRMLVEHGIAIDYMETNASWCGDVDETRSRMESMKRAGLPGLLVSVSVFHNEFVPFASTRNCIEVGREVFGAGGVLVYMPHMYDMLSRMPGDGRHSLDEFCRHFGIDRSSTQLLELYGLIPGGRVVQALRGCFDLRPAEAFRGQGCRTKLLSTSHFHIDQHGDLFTGGCAGMVPATVEDFHAPVDPDKNPVFSMLCADGPYGLFPTAREHGFVQREGGYAGKCDLCFDIRKCLCNSGGFPELRPREFYA